MAEDGFGRFIARFYENMLNLQLSSHPVDLAVFRAAELVALTIPSLLLEESKPQEALCFCFRVSQELDVVTEKYSQHYISS